MLAVKVAKTRASCIGLLYVDVAMLRITKKARKENDDWIVCVAKTAQYPLYNSCKCVHGLSIWAYILQVSNGNVIIEPMFLLTTADDAFATCSQKHLATSDVRRLLLIVIATQE
jgi:hypothetical protein